MTDKYAATAETSGGKRSTIQILSTKIIDGWRRDTEAEFGPTLRCSRPLRAQDSGDFQATIRARGG